MSKRTYIKNEQGLYRVRGYVHPEELVSIVAEILYDDLSERECLSDPEQAARFLQLRLANEPNEHFSALFLDTRHRVLGFERLFSGTIDGAAVYPRVVVQKALECNAAALILAHNHPSNDCEPSSADRAITRRLSEALALVDVRLLDHFIVSGCGWVSLAQRGLI